MGLLFIDIKKIKVDYFVFVGYKILYGFFGIGGFIDNSKVKFFEVIIGGIGLDLLNLKMFDIYLGKYEVVSFNILLIVGLYLVLDWINDVGIDNIIVKEMKLIKKLIEGLKDIDEIKMYLL